MLVLIGRGPMGAGMEETYQITSALKHLPFGKHVAVITDARFSGVSTGACIGSCLAGGVGGRAGRQAARRRHDRDRGRPQHARRHRQPRRRKCRRSRCIEAGSRILGARQPRSDLAPDPLLPDDTRIWAALQDVSGGTWGGAVYDVDAILKVIEAGKKAQRDSQNSNEMPADGMSGNIESNNPNT